VRQVHRESDTPSHAQSGICTFGYLPFCDDLDNINADVAILGIPYENTMGPSGARLGPRGLREISYSNSYELKEGSFSPDDDGEIYLGPRWKIVDCGDVPVVGCDVEPTFTRIRDTVRRIAANDVILVSIGGDHAITTPVLEGLSDRAPFGIIHIDAHMDWADYPGRPYCHSKPMRRASEMEHVTAMAQIGVRAFHFTSKKSYQDAIDYGSRVFTPRKLRALGVEGVLKEIPKCDRYYVSIDIDGMDPSIAPGTGSPDPGGLLYDETRDLLQGIASLGEVIAFDLVEVAPPLDLPVKPTCMLACRLICDLLGFVLKEKEHSTA